MIRFIRATALILCVTLSLPSAVWADSLGPARSYDELLSLAALASDGDVILISGDIAAVQDAPLTSASAIRIRSSAEGPASIDALRLKDAAVTFDDIDLNDSLIIEGLCAVEISRGVTVRGADGCEGIRFTGGGTLLLGSGSLVVGGSGSAGVTISHENGDFYGHFDGAVRGGSNGGVGVEIAPLQQSGALMVSGSITGGDGANVGGHALNLYGLSGNAYVTLGGTLSGGSGLVGGNGVQIVSATGSAIVGIDADIRGGQGATYGGNALVLMNVEGGSSVSLTGSLRGGDVTQAGATAGTSLLVVGDSTSSHVFVSGCHLEDGHHLNAQAVTPEPAVTPLPEITSSVEHTTTLPQDEWDEWDEWGAEDVEPDEAPDQQDATPAEPDAPQTQQQPDSAPQA